MGRKNKRLIAEPFIRIEKAYCITEPLSLQREPASRLSLGQWTAFTDFNLVADTTFVVLVMYVQFGRTLDEFTVDPGVSQYVR